MTDAVDTRRAVRTALMVRPDQLDTIDQIVEAEDLTRSQVVRRLLDLGLENWRPVQGLTTDH
jgi:hypothetical protein